MRSRTATVVSLMAALWMLSSCAGESGTDLQETSAALTDDCVSGCVERGGEESRCAEACASIGGAGCVDRCTARGGDSAACEERCSAAGTATCFDRCMASGADQQTCQDACLGGDGLPSSSQSPADCVDGEEIIRNGVTYVCTAGEWVEK